MKILIVCSGNAPKGQQFDFKLQQAFIYEQVEALKKLGLQFDYFLITKKGFSGYLKHYRLLKKVLGKSHYDLIHAHNGLSGFIANIQNKVPVVTTYHGSDINLFYLRLISYFSILRSSQNIFVSSRQRRKIIINRKSNIIPCGVDLKMFYPYLSLKGDSTKQKGKILFSSSFSISVKNYPLANEAIRMIDEDNIELIELKNRSREEVCELMNTSDLLLLTSFCEGSPIVIKEAMACNCPIVSTDVGDVREIIGHTEGCHITSFDRSDVARKIKLGLDFSRIIGRTNGLQRILDLKLDSDSIAKRIIEIYYKALGS